MQHTESEKKKWAKDIIILKEFALCTKFHEFDDDKKGGGKRDPKVLPTSSMDGPL